MKFGLKEEVINKIQQVFENQPEIDVVYLYGSRAKGNFNPGSDIDIALSGNNVTISTINNTSSLLDDLYLPYTFDLSIYKYINNPDLIDHIKRVGIEFYKRESIKTGS